MQKIILLLATFTIVYTATAQKKIFWEKQYLIRIGAVCQDDKQSYSLGAGTCSNHEGVKYWLYQKPNEPNGKTWKITPWELEIYRKNLLYDPQPVSVQPPVSIQPVVPVVVRDTQVFAPVIVIKPEIILPKQPQNDDEKTLLPEKRIPQDEWEFAWESIKDDLVYLLMLVAILLFRIVMLVVKRNLGKK